MIPKVNLGFGLIVAHFVPGVALLIFIMMSSKVACYAEQIKFVADYEFLSSVLFLGVALLCGLLLDAGRFLATRLVTMFNKRTHGVPQTSDDKAIYDAIIENHFRFHQAYCNLAFAFLVAAYLHNWWLLVLAAALIAASIFAYMDTIHELKSRFPIA